MNRLILAIDQGTTNSKVSLFDSKGELVREAARPVGIAYPQPGWVEQDAWELWTSVRAAAQDVLEGVDANALAGVAITNQRESVVLWERASGQPLGPCISWQCRRSAALCADLRRQGYAPFVVERTGLALDPMFSAGKACWLLDQIPDGAQRAANGEICLGTVDAWLLWNLSGGRVHACDVTNASRTGMFNLHTLAWDDELLALYGLPRALLPEVRLSVAMYGETAAEGFPPGVPIGALIGDSHGALYGHAGFLPGSIKATYGTGSSLMTPVSDLVFSSSGLSTSAAWGYKKTVFCLEGNIYATGAAVQWMARFLQVSGPAAVEQLARQAPDAGGVYFVPALTGLGAPHWRDDVRGTISGLTPGVGAAQAARAAIEAIAYQIRDVFDAMQADAGRALSQILVDGGATQNELLMQFQADILGTVVLRSKVSDVSALGAAYLAGLSLDVWSSEEELLALPRPHDRFEPRMDEKLRAELYAGWQEAVARTVYQG